MNDLIIVALIGVAAFLIFGYVAIQNTKEEINTVVDKASEAVGSIPAIINDIENDAVSTVKQFSEIPADMIDDIITRTKNSGTNLITSLNNTTKKALNTIETTANDPQVQIAATSFYDGMLTGLSNSNPILGIGLTTYQTTTNAASTLKNEIANASSWILQNEQHNLTLLERAGTNIRAEVKGAVAQTEDTVGSLWHFLGIGA